MTKALMMALCLFCLSAHAETKLNFSGDAYVRGYFRNSTGPDGTQAFNQYFRLNADAKPDEHLTIKTGLVLSGNTWEGDNHTNPAINTGTDQDGGGGDTTRLDHAFIEYNSNGWITAIGRQAVSSPGMFLTSDDRRDRVQVLKFQGTGLWAFVYDKRAEGTLNNRRDDLDMYSANYYGKTELFAYALQAGYFTSNKTVTLKDVKQFTPQINGAALGINYAFFYTFLGGGSNSSFYPDTHHSFAGVLSKDLGTFALSYQSIVTVNGGLIASGYDTFSSIVNNSPDHNQSSIKLRTIGLGLGRKAADEQLHILKAYVPITPNLGVSASAGWTKVYVWAFTEAASKIEKNKIVDLTAKYTISKNLNATAAFGKFYGDNKDDAGALALNANF
jgi:hypothetical protein